MAPAASNATYRGGEVLCGAALATRWDRYLDGRGAI